MLYGRRVQCVALEKEAGVTSTDSRLSGSSETRDILSSGSSVIQLFTKKKKNPVVETEDSAPSPKSPSSAGTLCIPDVNNCLPFVIASL